jgi:hypothetical protein
MKAWNDTYIFFSAVLEFEFGASMLARHPLYHLSHSTSPGMIYSKP